MCIPSYIRHLSTLPSFTISHPQVEAPGVIIEELSEEEVLPEPGHFLRYLFPGGPLHAEDAPPPRELQEGPPAEDGLPSQAGPVHAEHATGPPRKRRRGKQPV